MIAVPKIGRRAALMMSTAVFLTLALAVPAWACTVAMTGTMSLKNWTPGSLPTSSGSCGTNIPDGSSVVGGAVVCVAATGLCINDHTLDASAGNTLCPYELPPGGSNPSDDYQTTPENKYWLHAMPIPDASLEQPCMSSSLVLPNLGSTDGSFTADDPAITGQDPPGTWLTATQNDTGVIAGPNNLTRLPIAPGSYSFCLGTVSAGPNGSPRETGWWDNTRSDSDLGHLHITIM